MLKKYLGKTIMSILLIGISFSLCSYFDQVGRPHITDSNIKSNPNVISVIPENSMEKKEVSTRTTIWLDNNLSIFVNFIVYIFAILGLGMLWSVELQKLLTLRKT